MGLNKDLIDNKKWLIRSQLNNLANKIYTKILKNWEFTIASKMQKGQLELYAYDIF